VEHLNFLRLERNRPAHFDRPQTQEEAELRAARCGPHLEQALRKAELLRNMPWLAIVSVKYRPKKREFDITAHRVMGDHPDFEPCGFTWTVPVASDALYVLRAGKPVALSPFAASAFCIQCLRKEICYTQKLTSNRGPAILKSFDRGHEILNTLDRAWESTRSGQQPSPQLRCRALVTSKGRATDHRQRRWALGRRRAH
jgi:hypothetical protein